MSATVKDLMAEQEKRLRVQREKEQENRDRKFDTAQAAFARKPYFTEYGGEYEERLAAAAKHRRRCDECIKFNATYVGDRGGRKGYCTDLYKSRFRTGSCTACKRFKAKRAVIKNEIATTL
jgi:hypothetical protein